MGDPYISKGATISADDKYRYVLWREWRGTHKHENWHWTGTKDGAGAEYGWPKPCVFIMLNPSTADGEKDDPTIRRCVAFAKAWGYERLEVVNLFAFRATNPKALLALGHNDDPVGVKNQDHVSQATSEAGIIIAAWGSHGSHLGQDETVRGWIPYDKPVHVLGLTKDLQPRHPLYLRSDSKPMLLP